MSSAHSGESYKNTMERRLPRSVQALIGGVAAIGLIIGVNAVTGIFDEKSRVVAGVDAEVVGGNHATGVSGRSTLPYLRVVQCGADIEAALAGKPHQESFSRTPAPRDAECFIDSVTVSNQDFYNYPKGTVVVFAGNTGQPVIDRSLPETLLYGHPTATVAEVVPPPQTHQ
jgi:hypothetical protein